MTSTNQNEHPGKDFNDIVQVGLKAHALAIAHRPLLEPRLPVDTIENLSSDLTALGALVPGAKQVKEESKAATSSQNDALSKGHALISAIRANVLRRKVAPGIRKGYGVGTRWNPRLVKDIASAGQQIVERASDNAAEAQGLGILPKDIEALKGCLLVLGTLDQEQEIKRATSPGSTKSRNSTAREILKAVDHIIGAGILEFAEDKTLRAEFQALIGAGSPRKKEKKEKKEEGAP
jgi:hypothetical protein